MKGEKKGMSKLEEDIYKLQFKRELEMQLMAMGYYEGDIADRIGSSTIHATMIMRNPDDMTVAELKEVLKMLHPERQIAVNYILGGTYR